MPGIFTVASSPVTSAGMFGVTLNTQSANTLFAGPTSGVASAPSFRSLVPSDIPGLPWSQITSGVPTTIAGYGITDAIKNAGGTGSIQEGLAAARPAAGNAGNIYITTDTKIVYRDNGATWDLIAQASGSTPGGAAGGDLAGTYPNPSVAKIQGTAVSSTAPTDAQAMVYNNGSSNWTPVTLSGDATINNTGAVALKNTGTAGILLQGHDRCSRTRHRRLHPHHSPWLRNHRWSDK